MQLYIHNYAEIISAIICTVCYFYKPSVLNRWFIWFLWITVTIELTGKMTSNFPIFKMMMYNIFNGVEFMFYFFVFRKICEIMTIQKVLKIFIFAFLIFFLCNLLFLQGAKVYNSNTHTLGSSFVIAMCLLSLIYSLLSEDDNIPMVNYSFFCVIAGLLFFYSGNIFNSGIINYMMKHQPKDAGRLYKLINNTLNVVLYGFFSIAFILEQMKKRKVIDKYDFAINQNL